MAMFTEDEKAMFAGQIRETLEQGKRGALDVVRCFERILMRSENCALMMDKDDVFEAIQALIHAQEVWVAANEAVAGISWDAETKPPLHPSDPPSDDEEEAAAVLGWPSRR